MKDEGTQLGFGRSFMYPSYELVKTFCLAGSSNRTGSTVWVIRGMKKLVSQKNKLVEEIRIRCANAGKEEYNPKLYKG